VFVTTNGGEARSQGIEWAFSATPVQGFTISWSGSAVDAELTSDAPGIAGLAGDNLPYVPKFSSTVDLDYRIPLSDTAAVRLGGSWSHIGERNGEFIAFPLFSNNPEIPDYDTVDLRAGLEFGNYRFDALARNIGNTVGITGYRSAAGFNGETGQAAIVQPRSFILRISGQF
jgi:outer membrane receptor protein involved in Fe transport